MNHSLTMIHTGRFGRAILAGLDSSPTPTWRWERRALFVLELLAHTAMIAAAPTLTARVVMTLSAPIAVYGSLLAQTARSAAARKRELAELATNGPLLDCEIRVEDDARKAQLLSTLQPLVTLVLATLMAGGSVTIPAIVAAIVSGTRVAWSDGYTPWRRWMRARRPRRHRSGS